MTGVRYSREASRARDAAEVSGAPNLHNFILLYFHPHICFPASGQAMVIGVVPFFPPGSCLQLFIAHRVQQSKLLVDFSSSFAANSRSRAFRMSVYAQEKCPTTSNRVCTRGDIIRALNMRGLIPHPKHASEDVLRSRATRPTVLSASPKISTLVKISHQSIVPHARGLAIHLPRIFVHVAC